MSNVIYCDRCKVKTKVINRYSIKKLCFTCYKTQYKWDKTTRTPGSWKNL